MLKEEKVWAGELMKIAGGKHGNNCSLSKLMGLTVRVTHRIPNVTV